MPQELNKQVLGLEDYAMWFKKKHSSPMRTQEIGKICRDANKEIMRLIVEKGFKFYMPEGLGTLRVSRRNKVSWNVNQGNGVLVPMTKYVDWKRTKDTGVRVFLENEHTNGYYYRFLWQRYKRNFRFKALYTFIPSRENKRKLAKILKDPDRTIDYLAEFNGI